jgi:hypothetical protein
LAFSLFLPNIARVFLSTTCDMVCLLDLKK